MYRLFILLILCFSVMTVTAQDSIIVKKDPRLDVLTAKQAALNKRNAMMTSSGQYKGYRVQVISTRDRNKAFEIKSDLLSRFPEEKSYTVFQSPYFRVRIGNFIDKKEADEFRKMLSKYYKEGMYVVADVIDYAPQEDDELFID
jgi:hypothetical protein